MYNQHILICEEFKHFNTNFIMVIFEVKLLFTSIALQEMIDLCVQKLFKDKKCLDDLSKDSFRKMLTVTMTESFISFDNEYHR